MDKYNFHKTKYGSELLIDLIRLESLEKYICNRKSHILSYYDITLITEGKGNFQLDEFQIPFEPGMLIFSSPGQVRKWEIQSVPKGLVLLFEEEFLCRFFNDAQFVQNLTYFGLDNSHSYHTLSQDEYLYMTGLMKNIESEINDQIDKDDHMLRALLYQTLVWINRQYMISYQNKTQKTSSHIADFIKQVNENFMTQHSVTYYADKLCVTSTHLNDLVKQHMGISAKQYIKNRIFLEAKRFLIHSSLSISEIAWKLNFQDNSYFTRAFKKNIGHTPFSFRKKFNP